MKDSINEELLQFVAYEKADGSNLAEIKRLIDNGADVNFTGLGFRQVPLLSIAISNKDLNIVSLLLSEGADPNRRCVDKDMPLMYLINSEIDETALKIAEALLENGADMNLQNHDGRDPIRELDYSIQNHPVLMGNNQEPLDKLKQLFIENSTKQKGEVEKSLAIINNIKTSGMPEDELIEAIEGLISAGGDINYIDYYDNIAINYAVNKDYYKLTAKLMDWGSDISSGRVFTNAIMRTKNPKMVELLIQKSKPEIFTSSDRNLLMGIANREDYKDSKEKQRMLDVITTTKYIDPVITNFNKKKSKIKDYMSNRPKIGGIKR